MSTALVKLTEEKIGNNNQLQAFVQQAKAVANVIFPENIQFADPSLRYGVRQVTVNSGDSKQVYKDKTTGDYLLHSSKIKEFVDAVSIRWTDSQLEERKYDEKGQVTYVRVKVFGELKSVDGTIKQTVASGTYDYYADKINFDSEKQVNKRRYKADQLAETNAKYRAVKDLFPKLPSLFSESDLKKPFFIPYVLEDKNLAIENALKDLPVEDQTLLRKQRAAHIMGIADTIYSPSIGQRQIENTSAPEKTSNVQDANIIEEKPMFTPEEKAHIDAETYRDAPVKERIEKILTLYKLKGLKNADGSEVTAAQVEKSSIDKQIIVIEKLLLMDDQNQELPL